MRQLSDNFNSISLESSCAFVSFLVSVPVSFLGEIVALEKAHTRSVPSFNAFRFSGMQASLSTVRLTSLDMVLSVTPS